MSRKIIYCVGFRVDDNHGKSRATRQKFLSLRKLFDESYFISLRRKGSKVVGLLLLEFQLLHTIVRVKPDVVITRGFTGYFSRLYCKVLKILFVREVHADIISEADLLDKSLISKCIIKTLGRIYLPLEKGADKIIFNHPSLMDYFVSKYQFNSTNCFFVYNGFGPKDDVILTEPSNFNKYFNSKFLNCVFVGAASKWHGVEYIVRVAKELDKQDIPIRFIMAGGKIETPLPSNMVNITPLDADGCNQLVSMSDVCLLPVNNNRVSPGSPLKLYDYIANGKYILTQENVAGYSDEVKKYGFGDSVDFTNTKDSAKFLVNLLERYKSNGNLLLNKDEFSIDQFSWDTRMKEWVDDIFSNRGKC